MSISDMIVVMKLGVVQQIGAPQAVYDDPTNLFVAKFLGTPPVNVFDGYVKEGKLYMGGEKIDLYAEAVEPAEGEEAAAPEVIGVDYVNGTFAMDVPGVDDQPVYVGIRPEGFIVDDNGTLTCSLSGVDVMGRDVSLVTTHPASLNPVVRSIVDADSAKAATGETVTYSLKPHKVFLFNKETEERVYFEVK